MASYRGSGRETVGVTDSVPVSGYKYTYLSVIYIDTSICKLFTYISDRGYDNDGRRGRK